jgi:hypothetical protein
MNPAAGVGKGLPVFLILAGIGALLSSGLCRREHPAREEEL